MPRTTRCRYCPAATSPTGPRPETLLTPPLFVDEAVASAIPKSAITRQERMLREAITPYLCLADLRKLVASGEDVQAALREHEAVPEEVQALISLLRVLLMPRSQECIGKPADIASILMLEMGQKDQEEFVVVCLDTKNHVQRIHRLYRGTLNSSVVRVAEVFRVPIALNSAAIIVAHTHRGCRRPARKMWMSPGY
jgi:DNA repair protein RadC